MIGSAVFQLNLPLRNISRLGTSPGSCDRTVASAKTANTKRERIGMNRGGLRRAVTLIEVIFSIGVVLVGLLGLLSILPLAGQRAQDSISLSVGPAVGIQVISQLESRRYLGNGQLRRVPALAPPVPPVLNNLTATPVSPATAVEPFCIDPMFAASTVAPASVVNNGYTGAMFPYYKDDHNPFVDPSNGAIRSGGGLWPTTQPRLTRVGITRKNNTTVFLNVSQALAIAENRDDLFVTRAKDKTLNATFKDGDLQAIPTPTTPPTTPPQPPAGLEYGVRIPNGEFTWFATVNPFPGNVYASVSVVVLRKRIRNFSTPTATTPPGNPEGNGVGERLAYVTFASGFSGGAGGLVHLVANANTVSKIRSDDWIMLSRKTGGGDVFHRWYRVVAVNGKAQLFTTIGTNGADDTNLGASIPGSAQHQVWRHKIVLDGPDWSFDFKTGGSPGTPRRYADDTFGDNTFATIVSGVVSVTERTVRMSDL